MVVTVAVAVMVVAIVVVAAEDPAQAMEDRGRGLHRVITLEGDVCETGGDAGAAIRASAAAVHVVLE